MSLPASLRVSLKSLLITAFSVLSGSAFSFTETGECVDGLANEHQCSHINLSAKLTLTSSGLTASSGNDIWGWTDLDTGREYALMGMNSKTAFVDVTNPKLPIHIGDLPTATYSSSWRDIKVYNNYAFIVSEAYNHGMQVFDLTKLRLSAAEPQTFEADAHYRNFGSAHNIVINQESGFAYAVGSNTCDAGMHIVDVRNPLEPSFVTCIDRSIFEDVGVVTSLLHGEDYTHDAHCVIYEGPDARFHGQEICVCSNADTVNIVDVTDKGQPIQISVKDYNGLGYTHQGWLTEDQRYFLLGDELDEMHHGHKTKTLIWDLADLTNPVHVGSFISSQNAIDHNMYVRGNLVYQANYDAGLRVLDISDIANAELTEIAYFDTEPDSDKAEFLGAWSVYPYFESGTIIVSNIDGDLYVLTPDEELREKMLP